MNRRRLLLLGKRAVLAIALAAVILLAGCGAQEIQTNWSARPVKVDGEMTEWPGGSTVYFEDIGAQLGLSNDDRNLYVLFRFSDQAWARAIRMGGVTIWLDNSGKKSKDFGIRYTGGPALSDMRMSEASDRGGFREAMTPDQKQRLSEMEKAMADRITLIDKKNNQEITLRTDGSGGPAASSSSFQGIYTYEFSIPLERGNAFDCGIGARPGQIISLGFEWGGISKEDRQKMKEKTGGSPPGGMGGGPPGGMGGGQGQRPGGPGPQSAEKQELWVKTQLASPVGG